MCKSPVMVAFAAGGIAPNSAGNGSTTGDSSGFSATPPLAQAGGIGTALDGTIEKALSLGSVTVLCTTSDDVKGGSEVVLLE